LKVIGDHIDINTTGKTLVLPTETEALPSFNERVLNPNRGMSAFNGMFSPITLSSVAPATGAMPYSNPLNKGYHTYISLGNSAKITLTGDIKKVKFALSSVAASIASISFFSVDIWRNTGDTFERVSTTGDLTSQLIPGINEITLSSPISAQKGDYYSVSFISTEFILQTETISGGLLKYTTDTHPISYDWDTLGFSSSGKQYTVYLYMDTPRTVDTLSPVAPYSGTMPYDNVLNRGYHTYINLGHTSRIRQTGNIKKVKFALSSVAASIASISFFSVDIWRNTGDTFERVSTTGNISALLGVGINEITLENPIAAQHGDYYSVSFISTEFILQTELIEGGLIKYTTDTHPTEYTWLSSGSSVNGKQYTVYLYMDSPDVAFIGDSTTAGAPLNGPFTQLLNTSFNPTSSTAHNFADGHNISYQNMGIGGQNAAEIRARFEADIIALSPGVAVIETGLNEGNGIIDPVVQQGIIDDIAEMVQLCIDNNIIPVVFEVPPATMDTVPRALGHNAVNVGIHALQNSMDFFIFESRSSVGIYDPETTQWSILPDYDYDGVHYTVTGYEKLGSDLYKSLFAKSYPTTFVFENSTHFINGLQNLSKPWIALYDPANSLIDFYLFTHRPQNLSFKRDETGTIYSLSLYPGAGSIYHGQIPFADLTLDTNSDSVPDCLEATVNGSVTKFLANYSMVI